MKPPKSRNTRRKNELFTLILIPGNSNSPWKINLTTKMLKMVLSLAALIIIAAVVSSYVMFCSQAEISRVEAIKQESREKDETIRELEKQMQELESQQADLASKQAEIKKLMGLKNDSRVETPNRGLIRESSGREALLAATAMKKDLSLEINELTNYITQVQKDQSYFLAQPNQWPNSGEVSSSYGWRKAPYSRSKQSFHDGIDIANQVGSPILAAGQGKVIFTGWKPVYGKTVEIDHGYGQVTRYGHNSKLLVQTGDQVKKGQKIANMGTTGISTGPHLHFTIIKDGLTQDPEAYLP